MITQQRVRISTTVSAATLALSAARVVGGATGYAVRGFVFGAADVSRVCRSMREALNADDARPQWGAP